MRWLLDGIRSIFDPRPMPKPNPPTQWPWPRQQESEDEGLANAEKHLITQTARHIVRLAITLNVPPAEVIHRLMSESEGVVVEIGRVTSSSPPRANGSLYRINAEFDLQFTETGTYRLTRIEGDE